MLSAEDIDGRDNELVTQNVQLITQNQEDNRSGYFLRAHFNSRDNNTVTTTGRPDDPESKFEIDSL